MKGSGKTFWWIAGILFLLFPCACLGISPALLILETVGFLAFGWVGFLWRVVPQVEVKWDMVATSIVCAVALVVGSHRFLSWLYRETFAEGTASNLRRWRWRWTLSGAALVFLMFSAGIGAVGVVHQTAWLATSPVPLVSLGLESANRVKCASNLRQIGQAISAYAGENKGEYPDDFVALLLTEGITPEVFVCPESDDTPATGVDAFDAARHLNDPHRCSYIYFGKGLSLPVAPDRVIAAEKLENHEGEGMIILFGDGHVDFVNKEEASKLLGGVGAGTQATMRGR